MRTEIDPGSGGGSREPLGPGLDDLRQRTIKRVLARLIRLRGLLIPLLLGFTLWIGLSDTALWRQIVMFVIAGVITTLIGHDVIVSRRVRAGKFDGAALTPNLVAVAIMQHVIIFTTGGMASPVLPAILPVLLLTGLFAHPRHAWIVVATVHIPALWIDAGVQLSGALELMPTALAWADGSPAQTPITTVVMAVLMSVATIVITVFSTITSSGLNVMVDDALRARDSALLARNAQARELTTLTGEIAHELKNPLASVKGLAQLVGRELEHAEPDGKSAERMQVLRREVDRMQAILDEFLNFSRPLVPLSQHAVELRKLVDHVVDLHEGVAGERRVELHAFGAARVVCDPRKVEQILINLVQNALDVAPPGTKVEVEVVDARPHEVRVHVRDAGPGLAESVRARVFEPGVTDKADGSGLGLTVARALARQHGGELELDSRRSGRSNPNGGCEATLILPLQHSQAVSA